MWRNYFLMMALPFMLAARVYPVEISTTAPVVPRPPAELLELLKNDMAARLKTSIAEVNVEDVKPIEWPDMSLGCPQPGALYGMSVTPGYLIQVGSGNDRYAYHTDQNARFVLCSADENAATDIRYVIKTDPQTKIKFPWLKYYRDREIMQRVNERIGQMLSGLKCEDDQMTSESDFAVTSNVSYAERDIFSIEATVATYCGGSYPTDKADMSVTFDLRRGDEVKFPALFRDYEADKEEIIGVIFPEQIKQAHELQNSVDGDEKSCGGNAALYSLDNLATSSFSYSFSSSGLQVKPDWPRRVAACAQRVTVPYDKLRRFGWYRGMLARAR